MIETLDRKTSTSSTTAASQKISGIFKIMSANEWLESAKKLPIPKMLFSEFWFEGELCILFADTNVGKSLLAVQIGNSISKGENIDGFKLEAIKQPVLYFDFELSEKQFERRYSNDYDFHYLFDNDFLRVEMESSEIDLKANYDDMLIESIEKAIVDTGCKVVIIDNITYLNNATETAKDALPLMKRLKEVKKRHDLSMLILAHTPKRDLSRPITLNDLQGSKMLANFMDSSFSISSSSQSKNTRYIKQMKQRNTPEIYNSNNVCVCEITKPNNFVQFEFVALDHESAHIRPLEDSDREHLIAQAKEMSNQGRSQRDIAKELGIGLGTVHKYINQ